MQSQAASQSEQQGEGAKAAEECEVKSFARHKEPLEMECNRKVLTRTLAAGEDRGGHREGALGKGSQV